MPEKDEPLIAQSIDGVNDKEAARVLRTFLTMCVSFSLNMGVVTTVIAFAGADFPDIGVYSVGVLYAFYVLSAMLLGPLMQALFGLKRCLVFGLTQYCVYLLVYLIAELIGSGKPAANAIVLVGAAIGGIGSGYLWPAQGAYFAQAAKKYAKASGKTPEEATGVFASYFATCFLFCEISFKFIGAGIKLAIPHKPMIMYLVFFCVGVISVFGMMSIQNIKKEEEPPQISMKMVTDRASLAIKLLLSDSKMSLMLPFEFTFGFAAAFLNGFISPQVTKDVLGTADIGWFSGIIAGIACVVSAGGGWYIKTTGKKWPLMLTGALCFIAMAVPFLFGDSSKWKNDIGGAYWKLSLIYAAQGVGRGIFESTNKAVVADFFKNDAPAAFSNVIWSSGGASAIGYFLFKNISGKAQAWVVVLSGVMGVVCYLMAHFQNQSQKEFVNVDDDDEEEAP